MYARLTPYRVDPARVEEVTRFTQDEVTRFTQDEVIPAVRRLPGFRQYLSFGDRTTGRGYAITVWDTAEQADGLRSAIDGLLPRLNALGLRLEPAEVHEVAVHVQA
jgi:hypothetical protein